ncbi:MAG: hypothetical protein LBV44_07485 [Methylobacillus sp.]|jgi:hypothetical protein|nr:hypothetical protein [Methylobacillus sp.]
MKPERKIIVIVILTSVILYAVALCVPAIQNHVLFKAGDVCPDDFTCVTIDSIFYAITSSESWAGWEAMLNGLLFGPFQLNFAGYANLFLWAGWVVLLIEKKRAAIWFFSIAGILTLQTFQLYINAFPMDEGVVKWGSLAGLQTGYYLWIAAIVIPLIAAVNLRRKQLAQGG